MFLVYGVSLNTEPLVWEVAVLNTQKEADEYAQLCYDAANKRFNDELSNGFSYSDSIAVKNIYDINAQYHGYNHPENEGEPFTVDIEYRVREILHVTSIMSHQEMAFYRKLKGDINLGKSYKWPEDGSQPVGYDDEEHDDYTLLDWN